MNIEDIVSKALAIIDWFLSWVLPSWWAKARVLLVQAIIMVEASATTEKGDEKRKKAIDGFEAQLVSAGLIADSIEKAFDPVIDWALEWAVDAIVAYLNKTFGKDWIKIIEPNS
ncbi:MAG: hypothetical protein ACP5G8_03435 [Athalassotoga sp.]